MITISEPPNDGESKENQNNTQKKSIEQQAAENVAKALAIENAKLKHELSSFDSEFFEELEDLKLKCAELQVSSFKKLTIHSSIHQYIQFFYLISFIYYFRILF